MPKPDVTLNLNLPYPVRKLDVQACKVQSGYDADDGEQETNGSRAGSLRDVSDFLIRTAVNSHPKFQPTQQQPHKGQPETDSRLWDGIMRQLSERADLLTLPHSEFCWLHDLVKSFEYRPSLATWRWVLLDDFDRAKKVAETPPASAKDQDKPVEKADGAVVVGASPGA